MHRLILAAVLLAVFAGGLLAGVAGHSTLEKVPARLGLVAPTSTPQPTVAPVRPPVVPRQPAPGLGAAQASREVVVEVTEADLDAQLKQVLVGQSLGITPLGDARIASLNVRLRDGEIVLDGDASVGAIRAPFTIAGTLTPDSFGRGVIGISEALLGGVLLPDPMRTLLAQTLQTQVDQTLSNASVRVRSIEIANGRLRLVGQAAS
ncbi:MAG: hypothetical protein IT305_07395 [Chloroflexi bacterium]|nr:hypothetical protein [Chloroflexota bacterium]